jgi:hypothetical protein
MVYLPGSAGGTAVANNAAVPFSVLTPSSSSGATLVGSALVLAEEGVYQVTFGFAFNANATSAFEIQVNGVTPGAQAEIQGIQAGGNRFMSSLTTIIAVPAGGSLTLVNVSGAARTLNNATATAASPAAYITAVKL